MFYRTFHYRSIPEQIKFAGSLPHISNDKGSSLVRDEIVNKIHSNGVAKFIYVHRLQQKFDGWFNVI